MEAPAHHALDPGSSGGFNFHLPDEVSVRQVSGLPWASLGFRPAADTPASGCRLEGRLLLPEASTRLHSPISDAKKIPQVRKPGGEPPKVLASAEPPHIEVRRRQKNGCGSRRREATSREPSLSILARAALFSESPANPDEDCVTSRLFFMYGCPCKCKLFTEYQLIAKVVVFKGCQKHHTFLPLAALLGLSTRS